MANQAAKVKTPISTTSRNVWLRGGYRPTTQMQPARSGFTLLELLVVLAIGALLVGLVPPQFERLRASAQYRDCLRNVMLTLRQARQQATDRGEAVTFRVDLNGRHYGIVGQAVHDFPDSLEVRTTVGTRDGTPNDPGRADIVFLPDGGATGGSIELARANGGGVRVRVDWLLGQITQVPRG